jgi:hypothetical protein
VCNTGANSQLHVGRLFLTPPYSTPPPFLLRTGEYAGAIPFNAFAYGVQWHATKGQWWFGADVTGDSGREFKAPDNFTRVEGGLRIVRTTKLGAFGLTAQGSDAFFRTGLDYNTDPKKKLGLWLGVYYNDQVSVRPITGLALISYRLGRFQPHVMYDWRPMGKEELTVGSEYFLTDHVRLLGDYEIENDRFLFRTQFKF